MRKNLAVEDLGNLVELPLLAVLATCRRDGTVLLSPAWHEGRDGGFQVVTGSHDAKAAQLRRDPRASIVVCEHVPALPRSGVALSCPARHRRCRRCGEERVASRYLGAEAGAAYAESAGDDLVIRLEPGILRAWDFAAEFS
jgi:hypothetical protein